MNKQEDKTIDDLIGEFLGHVYLLTGTRLQSMTVEWDGDIPTGFKIEVKD
jgi:hypothetical protein